MCCTWLAENAAKKISKKLPSAHHRTNLSGYIFVTKTHIDNRKKLVKQQYLLQISPQYGEPRPTSGRDRSGSLGHPSNFNGFRVLAALLHGSQVESVSQTLLCWTEGATYVRQGDHHVGHWPTFLVLFEFDEEAQKQLELSSLTYGCDFGNFRREIQEIYSNLSGNFLKNFLPMSISCFQVQHCKAMLWNKHVLDKHIFML